MKRSDDRLRSSSVTRAATPTANPDAVVAELPWLRRLASRMAAEDAEDLVQDLWLLAARDRPQARGSHGLRPWLATAMRNRLRSVRRSATARSTRERSWTSLSPAPAEPEQEAMEADVARVLDEVLATLSESERALLRDRFFEGRSAADIAAEQGIPAATVRTRVRRSLHRLHAELRTRHGDRPRMALAATALPALPSSRTIATGAVMAKTKGVIAAAAVAGVVALGFSWASGRAQTTESASEPEVTHTARSAAVSDDPADSAREVASTSAPRVGARRAARPSDPHAGRPAVSTTSPSAEPESEPEPLALPAAAVSVRECATAGHEHEDCDFLEPDPEVLDEMARCGVVRYDFPAMFAQADWTPELEAQWLDLVGATAEERTQLIQIADDYRDRMFAELEALGREVGLDPWPTDVTLLSAVLELSEAVGDHNVVAASKLVAQERAGHVDPPESLEGRPVAERFLRRFARVGSGFEDAIAAELGTTRAHELHIAQDGWPGLKYQTGARCPD